MTSDTLIDPRTEPVRLFRPKPLFVSPMPERFLSWGPDVIRWIEKHCVYPQGPMIGKPFTLLEWQREWLNDVYACDDDGALLFRWAFLGVPKKNGKSALAAAIGLYHVFGDPDEPDPNCAVAATSADQAQEIYGDAVTMARMSESLKRVARVLRAQIEYIDGRPGRLRKVAASKGKQDGKGLSMLLADELHEWLRENWTVFTNATVGRERAQIIETTTAGYDPDTVCGDEYAKGVAIAKGEMQSRTFNFRWYGAPDGADGGDVSVWREANPSYGSLVTEATLRDQFDKRGADADFRRYFLNQWTGAREAWLEDGMWDACLGRIDFREREPVFVGWDASSKRDSTAVVSVQFAGHYDDLVEAIAEAMADAQDSFAAIPQATADPNDPDFDPLAALQRVLGLLDTKLYVYGRIWDAPLDPRTGKPIEHWRVPVAEIESYVRTLGQEFRVKEVAYDPMFITWTATQLEAQGMRMVEFPQTDMRMVQATQATYEMISLGKLVHNGDEDAARHIAQTETSATRAGGRRMSKGLARRPMDFSVALAMAVLRAIKSLTDPDSQNGGGVW